MSQRKGRMKLCARPGCRNEFYVKPSLERIRYCSQSCAKIGKPSNWSGRTPSPETRRKMREAKLGIRGPEHWNWRGGIGRTERQIAMARDEYRQWRTAVFDRDDYRCQDCGHRGGRLQAHHIKPWVSEPNLRYDVSNGLTLCETCHLKIPRPLHRSSS